MPEPINGVEAEALALGWAPLEEWRGDPKAWVDAESFVQRGHTIMPILKKNNQELVGKLNLAQTELKQVKDALAETTASVKALTEFQAAEVKRQVEARVKDLRAEIREARKDGDDDRVDELTDRLGEAREALKATPSASGADKPPVATSPPPEPWAVEFAEANKDWLGVDKRKTAFMMAVAEELKTTTSLRGAELLAKAKQETLAFFDTGGRGPAPKSEGGSGGGGGPSSSATKGFSSLDAEARAACDSQERMMVGKGKPFKTRDEWRAHFVSCLPT